MNLLLILALGYVIVGVIFTAIRTVYNGLPGHAWQLVLQSLVWPFGLLMGM